MYVLAFICDVLSVQGILCLCKVSCVCERYLVSVQGVFVTLCQPLGRRALFMHIRTVYICNEMFIRCSYMHTVYICYVCAHDIHSQVGICVYICCVFTVYYVYVVHGIHMLCIHA